MKGRMKETNNTIARRLSRMLKIYVAKISNRASKEEQMKAPKK
jgi:hypothetical protein